jgi:hypothetical protein
MRYVVLLLLNVPIIMVALLNLITRYKLSRVTKERFYTQMSLWAILLVVFIASFPLYNYFSGKPILDSSELSLFDIVQTTAIIFLLYVVNTMRQKSEKTERTLRDLHQELSIRLSKDEDVQTKR